MVKVILLKNIKGYGQIGDIKNAADGYAKNFLLPNKIAKPATPGALKEIEILKKKANVMLEVEKKNAQAVAERLKTITIEIKRKANEGGTLFDGIDKIDIVEALKTSNRIELNEDMIEMDEKIKKIGEHEIKINLMPDVTSTLKILIIAE
ncbi:MAG: 50S ribosomal protein L9 [Parcubacteria group bacterium GW2011_GWC1_39_29]|nr:MAG: 50S ribosomal protein L9 [Parcubacteria group bacterium GW2011_GWC1_39_29]